MRTALLVLLLFAPSTARVHAQAGPESAPYRSAISAAIEEYDAKNYAEALEQFRHAHSLEPSARTLRGMAMAEFELRRYLESIELFEQALASRVKPLAGDLRSEAQETLARARKYVGELRLQVVPASAELTVDGSPRPWRADQALRLPVGEHVLELRAAGRAPERRVLQVEGAHVQALRITMSSVELREAHPLTPTAPADDSVKRRRRWLWTSAALLVVGGAVATAILLRPHGSDDPGLVRLQPPALTQAAP